ncbi:MAG: TIGR04325 family methyltransferase [Sulfurospirillaceae bacterium]|nr:TIGR04325 family methyltransferase [Sulfurospirillaceae bacterium]
MKQFIKSLLPPIVLHVFQKYRKRHYGWFGNYKNWQEAQNASTGYSTDELLQKVRASLLMVKKGEAVYERDSVLFDAIQYSWPLLSALMYAAAQSHGALHVMDFGGSLGSTYFQNKKFLDGLSDVSWNIVEQTHFVDIGRKEFEDDRLKFYDDIRSCVEAKKPNILVLSSVLQYMEKPYAVLDALLKYAFEIIIIDRTPFSVLGDDTIKLQIVPPSIYNASYPCWFFDFNKLTSYFEKQYKLIEVFNAIDGKNQDYEFKGFIMKKIQNV